MNRKRTKKNKGYESENISLVVFTEFTNFFKVVEKDLVAEFSLRVILVIRTLRHYSSYSFINVHYQFHLPFS